MDKSENSEVIKSRRPGRPPGQAMQLTSLLLEPELIEWAKCQPGGLSGVVRRLLKEARDHKLNPFELPH